MVGPVRPKFVLFGSSIVQNSFSNEGWGAILATLYARKVLLLFSFVHLRNICMWLSKRYNCLALHTGFDIYCLYVKDLHRL